MSWRLQKGPQQQKTMDQRLSTVRRDIQRITAEARLALLSSSSGNTAILGVTPRGGGTTPATTNTNKNNDNDKNDDDDTRAGMDLGLQLFGTSQSYTDDMEKEFDNRARALEDELASIRLGLLKDCTRPSGTTPKTITGVSRRNNHDDIADDDMIATPRVVELSIEEVERLQTRITILQLYKTWSI